MKAVVIATAWNTGRMQRGAVGGVAAEARRWKWGDFGDNRAGICILKMEVVGLQKYLSIFTKLHAVKCRTEIFHKNFHCRNVGYANMRSADCQCLDEKLFPKFSRGSDQRVRFTRNSKSLWTDRVWSHVKWAALPETTLLYLILPNL